MRTAKSDEISLLGYCMGGTLTSIYANTSSAHANS